ncbi:hypothetical protein [Flavobacterium sp. U410]|jgi:hypothetical protein
MKKLFIIFVFFTFKLVLAQETEQKSFRFNPKISLGIQTQFFLGNNYLSKGHSNPAIGGEFDFQFMSYSKFNLGFGLKKVTIQVEDPAIGGNIDKSNLNSVNGFISYHVVSAKKVQISPTFSYGGIEIRQKSDSKLYGVQNGRYIEGSVKINYAFSPNTKIYTKLGISRYYLNVKSTDEYKNYFNQTNSLNLSIGIQFL